MNDIELFVDQSIWEDSTIVFHILSIPVDTLQVGIDILACLQASSALLLLGGPLCPPQTSSGVQPQVDRGLAAARKMLDERRLEGAWKKIKPPILLHWFFTCKRTDQYWCSYILPALKHQLIDSFWTTRRWWGAASSIICTTYIQEEERAE